MAFKCDQCDKTFTRSFTLRVHMRSHNGERPFECKECGKSFGRRFTLKRHERVHSGIKPYVCKYCPQSFSQSSHLVRHERGHTGEKPYKCRSCPKSFTVSYALTRHEKVHIDESNLNAVQLHHDTQPTHLTSVDTDPSSSAPSSPEYTDPATVYNNNSNNINSRSITNNKFNNNMNNKRMTFGTTHMMMGNPHLDQSAIHMMNGSMHRAAAAAAAAASVAPSAPTTTAPPPAPVSNIDMKYEHETLDIFANLNDPLFMAFNNEPVTNSCASKLLASCTSMPSSIQQQWMQNIMFDSQAKPMYVQEPLMQETTSTMDMMHDPLALLLQASNA